MSLDASAPKSKLRQTSLKNWFQTPGSCSSLKAQSTDSSAPRSYITVSESCEVKTEPVEIIEISDDEEDIPVIKKEEPEECLMSMEECVLPLEETTVHAKDITAMYIEEPVILIKEVPMEIEEPIVHTKEDELHIEKTQETQKTHQNKQDTVLWNDNNNDCDEYNADQVIDLDDSDAFEYDDIDLSQIPEDWFEQPQSPQSVSSSYLPSLDVSSLSSLSSSTKSSVAHQPPYGSALFVSENASVSTSYLAIEQTLNKYKSSNSVHTISSSSSSSSVSSIDSTDIATNTRNINSHTHSTFSNNNSTHNNYSSNSNVNNTNNNNTPSLTPHKPAYPILEKASMSRPFSTPRPTSGPSKGTITRTYTPPTYLLEKASTSKPFTTTKPTQPINKPIRIPTTVSSTYNSITIPKVEHKKTTIPPPAPASAQASSSTPTSVSRPKPTTSRFTPHASTPQAYAVTSTGRKLKPPSMGFSRMKILKEEFRAERRMNAAVKSPSASAVNRSRSSTRATSMNGTQSSSSGSESSEDENDDNDGVSGLLGLCQDTSPPSLTLVEAEKASVKALFERSSRRTTQLIESPASRAGFERRQKIKEAEDRRKKTAPNIDRLFKMVLSWDIERIHDRPPNIPQEMYHSVKNKYTSFDDYVSVFEPLLLLETWAQLARSREFLCEGDVLESWVLEGRCHVNDFVDVTFMVPLNHVSKMSVDELVFVADHFGPGFFHQQGGDSSWKAKSFLGKIMSIIHKRAVADITMRCYFPKECITVLNSLAPKTTWKILRLMSMTTTQREYAAIQGLEYYDLVKEVISPENTPKPPIDEQKINHYVTNYGVNRPQATAIAGAITREKGFTLIQGPPGTGKTKTILGLIVSLLEERGKRIRHGESSAFGGKIKILVCAPSNAAVDEIAKRLKDGIKTVDTIIRPNIVRIGVADSVNASVKEFVLDRLIEKELGAGVDDQMSNKAWSQRRDKLNDELRKLQLDLEQLDRDTSDTKRDPVKMATLRDQRKGLLSKRDEIKVQIKAAYEDQKDFTREMEVSKIRARQKVFSQADVVCATLSGSGHDMLTSMGVTFDTVIVDEAAQSIEISTLIPLKYDCRRCVLVGDPNQLPPTVLSQLASKYNYEQSLFMRLENVVPQDVYLLSIQYRMHPAISAFPSQLFYNSKLQDGPRMSEIASAPWHSKEYFPPYRFYNVEDGQEKIGYGHSIYNPVEADAAVVLVDMLANQMPSINFAYKIGVITPYKQQLSQLKSRFEQRFGSRILDMIDFNTVDGFQGQEKEIIIFSCVRTGSSRGIGFLSDIRRMNVGLTRAKCSLFVLGNAPALIQSQYWGDLVRNAYDRRVLVNISRPFFRYRIVPGNITSNLFQKDSSGKSKHPTPDKMQARRISLPRVDQININSKEKKHPRDRSPEESQRRKKARQDTEMR